MAIGLALLLTLDQLLLWTLLPGSTLRGRPVAPFDPPVFSPAQRESLGRIRRHLETGEPPAGSFRFDAELGWCPRPDSGHGEFRYDHAGCRVGVAPLAREKAPGVRRVLAVGCSMTHGEEAAAAETWCAQVDAGSDALEVGNLGVAAFGIDQALLRLRRDGPGLAADEVWLGFFPAAAARVTTRYRPLLRHWSIDVAFKPAFELDDGGALVALANPARSLADVSGLLSDQERFLAALAGDRWVERARAAYLPRGTHLLHRSFVGRLGLTLWEAGDRDLRAWFRAGEHEVLDLLAAIVRATADEARAQGADFALLVLPDEADLEDAAAKGGRGYWSDFVERTVGTADAGAGLRVLDLAPALLAARDEAGAAALFAPNGHYSAAGNRVVARALLEWTQSRSPR